MGTKLSHGLLALAIALTATACWKYYYSQFVCRSPDARSEVRVVRNLPGYGADYKFRVEVSGVRGTTVIYNEQREAAIGLVEAHWSNDSTQLGLLVCNMLSSPVLLGYDLTHGLSLPGDAFRPILEQQIRRKYANTNSRDPVAWACSSEGNAAYRNLISKTRRSSPSPDP